MKTDQKMNQFGLRESDLTYLIKTLAQFDNIDQAIIFGSRAKGNYKNGSDVDIAIKGNIDFRTLTRLSYLLNAESPMPYQFDIINYTRTQHKALKEHINCFSEWDYHVTLFLREERVKYARDKLKNFDVSVISLKEINSFLGNGEFEGKNSLKN